MIYKRCSRCGKRLLTGTKCECIKKRHTEYDRFCRDRKSTDFYHSSDWQKKRDHIIDLDDGIDVYIYMTAGEIVIADTVHHIEQLRDNWEKRLSDDNLISLSHETHSMIERMYKSNDKTDIMDRLKKMVREYREKKG